MICAIYGKVTHKDPSFLVIKTSCGLSYKTFISLNTYSSIQNSEVELLTTQIIKDDGHFLYGFANADEQRLFESLLKISGVGAKLALSVCSSFSPQDFASTVAKKDITSLTRVPGLGKKTASLIILQLEGALVSNESLDHAKARQALESLGFKKDAISKAFSKCTSTNLEDLIKESLTYLQK